MTTGFKKLTIVFASHTFMGGTFVVGSHHLARCLANQGHRVLHLSTPVTPFHLVRWSDAETKGRFETWCHGGRVYHDGVIDYVPLGLIPKRIAYRLSTHRGPCLLTLPPIRHILRRYQFTAVDLLLVDQPIFVGLEKIVNPRITVYRATDLYSEMLGNLRNETTEKEMANRADFLIGTSQPVLERLRSLAPDKPASMLENGVDYLFFSKPAMAPPEYAEIPSPRLVYAGALDGRFGYEAVSATAKCLPHANVILIGPYGNDVVKQLGAGDNIHLIGPRKYQQLPAYFQHADIGLLPLSDHPANDGRSPMKLFEYGASGLPVVATRTAELTRRKLDFLLLADGMDEFASQVKNLVNNDRTRATIGLSAKDQSSNYSWEAITHRLLHDTFRGVSQSV